MALNTDMLSVFYAVIMLSFIMLSVDLLYVVLLSVMAQFHSLLENFVLIFFS